MPGGHVWWAWGSNLKCTLLSVPQHKLSIDVHIVGVDLIGPGFSLLGVSSGCEGQPRPLKRAPFSSSGHKLSKYVHIVGIDPKGAESIEEQTDKQRHKHTKIFISIVDLET